MSGTGCVPSGVLSNGKSCAARAAGGQSRQLTPPVAARVAPAGAVSADAERRQLTVMFCDPVDSTALSARLATLLCSKHCGKPWLSRPRLADCCAIFSFRSPYALATAISLRSRGRSSVNPAFDQQSPDDTGHLVGQGHGDQHLRLAGQHLR